jgi:GABA(A) receptor-associated protein
MYVIRKGLKMPAEQAIYLFINGSIPPASSRISSLYDIHKDRDKFLYINYSFENTFGY